MLASTLVLLWTGLAQKSKTIRPENEMIMLQAFDWSCLTDRVSFMNTLVKELEDIIATGFTGVWLPPQSDSAYPQGYLIQRWYTNVANDSLNTILKTLNEHNVMPIAEVILNHRAAPAIDPCTGMYTKFEDPPMGSWAIVRNDYNEKGQLYCPDKCNCGSFDTGENIVYAADLDHTNPRVRQLAKEYLVSLINAGFKGFRYDATKGFSGSFVAEYNTHAKPAYSVGEYFDGNRDLVRNWIIDANYESASFDFPLHFRLKRAIHNDNFAELSPGNAGLLDSLVPPEFSTTFVQNHDTAKTPHLVFGDADQILQGYAYILTHPGVPCVFWGDYTDQRMRTKIKEMIKIRSMVGIHSNSPLTNVTSAFNLYVAYVTGKRGTVALKMGWRNWAPDSSFRLKSKGKRFAVWVKSNEEIPEPTIPTIPSDEPPASVRFVITRNTGYGDTVYIAGSFNNWDPCNAIPCSWSNGNVWNCGPIYLENETNYEFKPIQFGSGSSTTCSNALWAPGMNSVFKTFGNSVVQFSY